MELREEIEKHFPAIEKFFTASIRSEFAATPISDLGKYNIGLGTMIRLKLLRPKSKLYKRFIKHHVLDKDRMTMIIIREFYSHNAN